MSINQLFNQFLGGQPAQGNQVNDAPANTGVSGGISALAAAVPGGLAGGLAAGGVMGLLMGNKKVRKTAGKMAGGALAIGGAAALGTVAYKAYQNWQGGSHANPQPASNDMNPSSEGSGSKMIDPPLSAFDPTITKSKDGQSFQLSLVKAMIAAANADGHIDPKEQKMLFQKIDEMDLEAADKAIVFDTLQNPPGLETVADFANGLEQASEIYLVSRLAIDPDHPAELKYLGELSNRMGLPDELVVHLENQLGAPAYLAA